MTWKKFFLRPGDHAVPIATVDMDIHVNMNTYRSNTCFKFISMLHTHGYAAVHVHVHTACPSIGGVLFLCCMPMSLLHVMSWRMSMSMLYWFEQAAWQGHAAWTLTCSWDMDMKHGHVHAPWTSVYMLLVPVHVHAAWLRPYYISMSMLHVHVHAKRSCPCSISQHILRVHAHAACPCLCCMSLSLLHKHEHTARTWTWSMDIDLQHGRGQQHAPGHAL
jgi:hypothetical protein